MKFTLPINPTTDYLNKYQDELNVEPIAAMRAERNKWFDWKGNQQYWEILEQVEDIKAQSADFSGTVPSFGKREELSDEQFERFHKALNEMRPWRKGPMMPFGIDLDCEWRSNLKWDRMTEYMQKSGITLGNKRIADIGCNNGYYMFRMLKENPELVIGFDPTMRYFMQYNFLQRLFPTPGLQYELLGAEHMPLYNKFFDIVFCMGILYHNTDPIGILRGLHKSLAKGGTLLVESQGIPGDMPVALFPEDRYAKVRGTYFTPTVSCLENWLKKANFTDIETFYVHTLTSQEQRSTNFMQWESLDDFLDTEDQTKTIEGYPAPIRIYVKAVKK